MKISIRISRKDGTSEQMIWYMKDGNGHLANKILEVLRMCLKAGKLLESRMKEKEQEFCGVSEKDMIPLIWLLTRDLGISIFRA